MPLLVGGTRQGAPGHRFNRLRESLHYAGYRLGAAELESGPCRRGRRLARFDTKERIV